MEERGGGSPRFGKLHFPVGLWINSPKKRLAKMSSRWPSAASVRSTSSDTTSRGSEPPDPRPPQKPKPPRHKRLSNLFHRGWASEKKLAELIEPLGVGTVTGAGGTPQNVPSAPPQPPGILKIFGGDLSRGANYKSVLATPRSSARELVLEALERYGVTPDGDSGDIGDTFVLCDVVGRAGGPGGGWVPEHLRVLGDAERPLVLQDVWKPKPGCSRRFEIRRRHEVERAGDGEEAVTPPPRRLQRNRSRAASGGPPPAPPKNGGAPGDPPAPLRRSISDVNLSIKRRRDRRNVLSVAPPATPPDPEHPQSGPPAPPDQPGGPQDEGGALEPLAQCLIQPPRRLPFFLLLRGYGPQDFVIYVMTRPQHVFGRRPQKPPEKPAGPPEKTGGGPEKSGGPPFVIDTFLEAPDILPRHCLVQGGGDAADAGDPPPATLRPFRGAPVTHNGVPLFHPAPLRPGDILGLGEHFLFLYQDPRCPFPAPPPWLPPPTPLLGLGGVLGCGGCGCPPKKREAAVRGALETPRPELRFRPQDREVLLREIVRLRPGGDGDPGDAPEDGFGVSPHPGEEETGALAPAFLLGLCLEHAGRAFPPQELPGLLQRVAAVIRDSVWEKIKEIGERQPELPPDAAPPAAPDPPSVARDLRPLFLWLANVTELLNLAQRNVVNMEREMEIEGPSPEVTSDLDTCDEAMATLDEVVMSTFQQCVYYLTKSLYATLPLLLESNPFSGAGEPSAGGGPDLGGVPEGLRPTLGLFRVTLRLSHECHLHPDLVSQTFGYLFFFCNASLFNTLMEKGGAGPFFQWWRGVRIRTNLDLVLEWLTALGLGDIAAEFFRKVSATATLLCTPKSCLTKASWSRLRTEYPALSPAQLHHVLCHYQLGQGTAAPPAWDPPAEERDEATSGDIFESFSEHPPLLLPGRGFRLRPGEPVTEGGLLRPLLRLRRLLWDLEQGQPDPDPEGTPPGTL
ncbi:ras-interacting protein 1 isoform X1 [Caloenas nicobarica]|uniref:ras-interacting protein 1 isoform X1 n=1 Tax=Caloenas nicobarica TaxID=187106 RepID=UPI0032B77276